MNPANHARLERKIAAVAASALSARQVVTPVEILTGIGWLNTAQVEDWRRGRVPYLERVATANLAKLSTALRLLHGWAQRNQLTPSETSYVAWTRDRHRLRFTKTGDANRTCLPHPLDLTNPGRGQTRSRILNHARGSSVVISLLRQQAWAARST